jgi:hypothetical protein
MGFGAIIRDYGGQVVAACSRTQESMVDAIVAEVLAGMVAATLCKDMGFFFFFVNLEGDSQQMVERA